MERGSDTVMFLDRIHLFTEFERRKTIYVPSLGPFLREVKFPNSSTVMCTIMIFVILFLLSSSRTEVGKPF